MTNMTSERAVAILTPGATKYTPREYEEALELARLALAWKSVQDERPERDEKVIACYGYDHGNGISERFVGVLDYYAVDESPHFQHENAGFGLTVTHWKPLPPLPEAPGNG